MARRERTVMEEAYRAIKSRILSLQYRPGEVLDDITVGTELGISRTPVREALFRLGADGLVVTSATRGGFTVRSLDLFDIKELFEAHMVVARSIARLAAVRATPEDLDLLARATALVDEAVRTGTPYDISETNGELHRIEARAAHNAHLGSLAISIQDQQQRLSFLAFGGATETTTLQTHFERVCADHHEALDAIRAHDADTAEDIAARHVRLFQSRIEEQIRAEGVSAVTLNEDLPLRMFDDGPTPLR